jgi:hypothetical protein
MIVGAQEPFAVPALRLDRRRHGVGRGAMPSGRRLIAERARERGVFTRGEHEERRDHH